MYGVYERIPLAAYAFPAYASAEEKNIKRETVSRFIRDAAAGDVYEIGGIGGKSELRVIARRGRLYLDSGRRTVVMSRANVLCHISNGARLVKRDS